MISVYFDIVDSSGNQLYTRVHISPYNTPVGYNNQIVSSDSVLLQQCTAPGSISLVPGIYKVRFFGKTTVSECWIYLPIQSDGLTVNASTVLVNPCPTSPAGTLIVLDTAYNASVVVLSMNGILGVSGPLPSYVTPPSDIVIWDGGYKAQVAITSANGVLGVSGPGTTTPTVSGQVLLWDSGYKAYVIVTSRSCILSVSQPIILPPL